MLWFYGSLFITILNYFSMISCSKIHAYNNTKYTHQFLNFIFGIKLYMFRTVSLSIIRSFSLYIQQWYMSNRFADRKLPANLYDIKHCGVYSEKLLMMERGTVRNM